MNFRQKKKNKMKGKQHVKVSRLNWDIEMMNDIFMRKGFMITESADVSLDGEKRKSLNGPQSPLYGTTYSDEHSFIERYRCSCGEFQGKAFEDEICPICGTKVSYKDADIEITGWINLGNNVIVNPLYYRILQKALGKNIFPDLVYCKQKVDRDGHSSRPKEEDMEDNKKPTSPYAGIGVLEFYENFEEIMDYFAKVRKNKTDDIIKLKSQKSCIFTHNIPIYSTLLRPQSITSETFYFTGIDKEINPLISLSQNLKLCADIERPIILNRIQKRVNAIWEFNFDLLNGKEGHIRNQLLGGSLNFTSRNVISPDPTLRPNEIDLSYHTFYELFQLRIIYYIMKNDNISLSKAYQIYRNGYNFDDRIYNIMLYIIDIEKPMCLINRNPTLDNIWCR